MSSKLRQYQSRAAHATQSAIIAQRMMPNKSPRDNSLKQPLHSALGRDTAATQEDAHTTNSSSSGGVDPLSASVTQQQRGSSKSVAVVQKAIEVTKVAEVDVPLPSPHDSINDFCVLPSTGKKVLQSFVFVRVERTDVSFAKRVVLGPQLEWKRRFMRVLCQYPGKERVEIYRTERRKAENPTIKEIVHSFPLSSLEFVQQQQLTQDEQLQFERFDYDSKKMALEYVFGHIRMILYFQQRSSAKERPRSLVMELCCTSSSERDEWVEYFVSFICKREREELLAYAPLPAPVVRMSLCPPDGVQRFTNHFLAGARNDQAAKVKEATSFGVGEGLGSLPPSEWTTSPQQWDVLILTTPSDREVCKVSCRSVGIFTMENRGEFPVASSSHDPHKGEFYFKPQDPAVADALKLYLNEDKMFTIKVQVHSEVPKFRQWAQQSFGLAGDSEKRSFHNPRWFPERQNRSSEVSSVDHNGGFHPLQPLSTDMPQSSISFVPFYQTDRDRAKGSEGGLRRAQSVVLQARTLQYVANNAMNSPAYPWGEMASLAYVEYCIIGSDPLPETSFKTRIVALHGEQKRIFVLETPPFSDVVLEFGFGDVTCITGYSDAFGDTGFTMHLFGHGIQVHVVPLRCEARAMWTMALTRTMPNQLLMGASAEQCNDKFLSASPGLVENAVAVMHAATLCRLCGEAKTGTPQCRVSGLQHSEYVEHVMQTRLECGSAVAALPMRDVVLPKDPMELVRSCRDVLERAKEAFDRATDV